MHVHALSSIWLCHRVPKQEIYSSITTTSNRCLRKTKRHGGEADGSKTFLTIEQS